MLNDVNLTLCTALSLAKAGVPADALTIATNTIDLQVAREVGEGHNTYISITVTTSFVDGGGVDAGRVYFGVLMADDAALTSNVIMPISLTGGQPILYGATGGPSGFTSGALVAPSNTSRGTRLLLPVPPVEGSPAFRKRYMTLAMVQPNWFTGFFSAGALSARVVVNPHQNDEYPRVG